QRLVCAVAEAMIDVFGAFLLVEVWTASNSRPTSTSPVRSEVRRPTFRVFTARLPTDDNTVQQLVQGLAEIPLRPPPLEVDLMTVDAIAPPGMPPLLPMPARAAAGQYALGIEVQPVYRQARTGLSYPAILRTLRRGLSEALKQTTYHFALSHSTQNPPHHHVFGRRIAARAARRVDAELTAMARSFDFLLQVTPVNAHRARSAFEAGGREREPQFDYRPLVVDTDAVKRRLYDLPLERVEDPTLAHLLGEARDDLDRKVTMLGDRNTRRFLYGSLSVYGSADPALHALALGLLGSLSPEGPGEGDRVGAAAFAERARREIAWYRERYAPMAATVEVREDVVGLMVSQGNLLVGGALDIPASRVEALLQHEVGTHVVTWYNGLAQPLGQMATGLAGYEELQEGLGVLAEHLVGGLPPARLRMLAGRVVAVHHVAQGAGFVESYRDLTATHGFTDLQAFTLCVRTQRSGGLTKDVIYLRGLVGLLEYLKQGGDLDPLFLGKVALHHVPVLRELRWREYLKPAPLEPRHLGGTKARERLARIRGGLTPADLINQAAS
ncbi:MAG TPA: tyrosine/phenylalanine carboxypeptidase domain-containing protein, partial [Gemmatimonadales bacterium]|nr:tyrosine/phenylalanine carboxypeptidase domain-containing protein [Gemmatimonadales bacterium]